MKQRLPAKRTTGWTSNLLAAAGDVLVPLLFAFGVGSIFSLICGCNPFTLYSYIIKKSFFSVGGLLNTLGYTTPIIITGMATALSIRANMYNMGIEGQVFLGAFTAALAGYMIKGVPTALHVTLCLLIGAAFGAVYALIPGLLKAKLRVNEVVTTVMLNSIATQVTGFLTQSYRLYSYNDCNSHKLCFWEHPAAANGTSRSVQRQKCSENPPFSDRKRLQNSRK